MADNSHQSAADAAAAAAEAAAAVAQSTGVQQQPDELKMFWTSQREEIQQINDFKNHKLPISRIKKIMKSGRDVRMITGEAPVLIAKACELFIMELTLLAWLQAQECKRRTMRKSDVVDAIRQTEIFDFLVDVISRVEIEEEATGFWPGMVGSTGSGVPNCYPPMEPLAPPMGRPAPPMGQPAPPMGRRAPQIGRRAPPIGPHAPPIGRLAPPMGPPAPPMGRPAPPIGRPAPPMGPRSPPMGRAAPPIGRPAPPMGPRSPPMGRPAPPIGRLAPPMGRPAPSGVMTRRRAMPWVAPSVHFRPSLQAWESLMQSAEDNSSATGRNSGQGKL